MKRTLNIALDAAAIELSPKAIDTHRRWLGKYADSAVDTGEDISALDNLPKVFAAATRARAWPELDAWLAENQTRVQLESAEGGTFFTDRFVGRRVGAAIARTATADGRAAGFEAARGILQRLFRVSALVGKKAQLLKISINDLVSSLAANCQDPGLLRDVARLLNADLHPEAPEQARLLKALADVDEAERPEIPLARLDPDTAVWVRRIRHLPEPEGMTNPTKRGRNGRRR